MERAQELRIVGIDDQKPNHGTRPENLKRAIHAPPEHTLQRPVSVSREPSEFQIFQRLAVGRGSACHLSPSEFPLEARAPA